MRGIVFTTRGEAEAAQREMDEAAGLPKVHAEGAGEGDWSIAVPGGAAARIRARGVRTEHAVGVVSKPDGTAHVLLAVDDASARDVALDEGWGVARRSGVEP